MNELPKISILIAARDEERNIIRCLQAVDCQDYPKQNA
jgi:cellulose synthase/poly-beta-1,6-N-acetylglucosamine synthase-like glycosyltransferase